MSKTAFHTELFFQRPLRGAYIQREMCVAKFANWLGLYLDGRVGSQSRLSK